MPNTAKRSGKMIVTRKLNVARYARLLSESLPKVIETEDENRRALAIVESLLHKGDKLTPEENALINLLAHLIDSFERRFYHPEEATPREVLIELMADRGLKQVDLVPLFGSKGITSEVVNGKRDISKAQARKLADFFHVPVEVFI